MVIFFFYFFVFSLNQGLGRQKIFWIHNRTTKIQCANPDGTEQEDLIFARFDELRDVEIHSATSRVFWAESGKIMWLDANNGSLGELVVLTGGLFTKVISALAVDQESNKVYWINAADGIIQRSNLNGSDVENVVTGGLNNTMSLALDLDGQKAYWSGLGYIRRANLDGTDIENLVTSGVYQPEGLTLDLTHDKMYWVDRTTDAISMANLDGSDVQELVSENIANPVDILVDEENNHLYWLLSREDGADGKLQRAQLDGSEVTDLAGGLYRPVAFAIDKSNDFLLWIEDTGQKPGYLGRMRTNGTNQDTLLEELSAFENLRLYEPGQKLYWMDPYLDNIYRVNYDGTRLELVVETQDGRVFEIDKESGFIYWTENEAIRRATLEGENIQDIIAKGVNNPDDLVLDGQAGKLYWADGGRDADRIKWANFDGSESADLITELENPKDLRIDPINNRIYWLEGSWETDIRCANKDGTSITDVIFDYGKINDYQLLPAKGKLFFSARDIFAANLDGSNLSTLIDHGPAGMSGLALDGLTLAKSANKLYWNDNDQDGNDIWRGNLDGSNVEQIIVDISEMYNREIVVFSGTSSGVNRQSHGVMNYHLAAVYPNPFNASTTVEFSLPAEANVRMLLFNATGQLVRRLLSERRIAGTYRFHFSARDLASGIYVLRLQMNNYSTSRKITLIK